MMLAILLLQPVGAAVCYESLSGTTWETDDIGTVQVWLENGNTEFRIAGSTMMCPAGDVVFPDMLTVGTCTLPITIIQNYAYCSGMTGATLGKYVKELSGSGFQNTNLNFIVLSDVLTTIASMCFNGCTKMTSLTLPASLTTINSWMNGLTGLQTLVMKGKVSCETNCFSKCARLSKVVYLGTTSPSFSGTVFSIAPTLVTTLKVTSIFGLELNGGYPLSYLVSDGVLTISSSNKQSVPEFEDFGTYITEDVKEIIVNSGVSAIDAKAFSGWTKLDAVTLPSTVTSVGNGAFSGCTSLCSFRYCGDGPVADTTSDPFSGCGSLIKISVPNTYNGKTFASSTKAISKELDSDCDYTGAEPTSDPDHPSAEPTHGPDTGGDEGDPTSDGGSDKSFAPTQSATDLVSDPEEADDGISTGEIAGIVAGIITVIGGIVGGATCAVKIKCPETCHCNCLCPCPWNHD